MRHWAGMFLALELAAQTGAVRGTLLEWDGSAQGGQLSVRDAANRVLVFRFDSRTAFERPPARLPKGSVLEVAADPGPATALRYARGVRVVSVPQPVKSIYPRRWYTYRSPTERLFPRGNLTFGGLVLHVDDERLQLRTRAGKQTVLLRQDTRYVRGGSPVTRGDVQINSWIFVRAGKNFENEIEAFQVVWGAILVPR